MRSSPPTARRATARCPAEKARRSAHRAGPRWSRRRSRRAPCAERRSPPPPVPPAPAIPLPAPTGLDPPAAAVQALKYHGRRRIADALGALLAERYPFDPSAVLVPVPLHPRRLRARGFNQAVLLARALARRRGLAVAPRLL